eukprot:1160058-Pelagomonas_calceolata.AAC.11
MQHFGPLLNPRPTPCNVALRACTSTAPFLQRHSKQVAPSMRAHSMDAGRKNVSTEHAETASCPGGASTWIVLPMRACSMDARSSVLRAYCTARSDRLIWPASCEPKAYERKIRGGDPS